MKLKYYLRGLGIGIIVTTLILMIAGANQKPELSDSEIIKRAEALGMVMNEKDSGILSSEMQSETEDTEQADTQSPSTETQTLPETDEGQDSSSVTEPETPVAPEDGMVQPESTTDTSQPYHLAVNAGEVCRQVCDELQANGVIDDSEGFRKYLSEGGFANQIQPGDFEIAYGLSYEEIAQILITRQ